MRVTSFLPFGCLGGNISLDRAPIHIYIYIYMCINTKYIVLYNMF